MIERLFSFILLILLLPIILIITIIILLDDGFPILFIQKRIGKNNEYFQIYQFRTMLTETPDVATHLLNNKKNIFTKVGPFIRKYSLDELPQLLNILKGDIAFIGPRPALFNQNDLIQLRTEKGIHRLMPGITGWAQVNGRDELSLLSKVELDHYYLTNKSLALDFKIILLTIKKVIKAEGVIL